MYFTFNRYNHWENLVIQVIRGTCIFLFIKYGLNQRYPLDMISYGLGIDHIISDLHVANLQVTQLCYTDDTGNDSHIRVTLYKMTCQSTVITRGFPIVKIAVSKIMSNYSVFC